MIAIFFHKDNNGVNKIDGTYEVVRTVPRHILAEYLVSLSSPKFFDILATLVDGKVQSSIP